MSASPEDTRTVKTILESLQSIIDRLTTRAISRAAEQECFEFMELLIHAIEADLHPGRVGTLMFTDNIGPVHPFNALACLMHPQLALSAKLRSGATRTFKSLFNAVTSKNCAPYLSSHALDAVQTLEIVSLMLQTVTGQHVDAEEFSSAAELLFVLVMQLPKIRDALSVPRPASEPWVAGGSPGSGVALLIRVLANSLMLKPDDALPPDAVQHVVAVLRVISDLHADSFIARELMFLPIVVSLMEREMSRLQQLQKEAAGGSGSEPVALSGVPGSPASILTLLLEIVGEIVLHFPSFYRVNVLRPSAALPTERDPTQFTISVPPSMSVNLSRRFCNILAECAGNSNDQDLRTAASAAIHQIFAIEGCDAPLENKDKDKSSASASAGPDPSQVSQPVMRAVFEDRDRWNRAISEAGTAPTFAVEKLRLQRSLVASAITAKSVSNIERVFMEIFPALCVLLDSSRSAKEPMREAAMIVALMCAKCPQIRRGVSQMVVGFEQWALRLRGTVVHILAKQGEDALLGLLVVDAHQCLLNDGEQLMPLENINYDKVAAALLTEQERRMTAAQPVVPLAGDLLEAARLWPKKAHQVASKLALSLLIEGTSLSLVAHHRSMPSEAVNPQLQTAEGIATKLLGVKNSGVRPDHQLYSASAGGEGSSSQHATPAHGRSTSPEYDAVPDMMGHNSPSTRLAGYGGGGDSPPNPNASSSSDHPHHKRRQIHWTPNAGVPRVHPIHVGETTGIPHNGGAGGGGGGGGGRTPRSASATVSASGTPKQTRSRQFLSLFGDSQEQKSKQPFRPASNSIRSAKGQFAFVSRGESGGGRSGRHKQPERRALTEALKVDAAESDDAFVSLALMMHLPISYGVHYNRSQKTVIRSVHDPKRPAAPWVTPVFRENQHSWAISDILEGDLYVLFVPFHKLSVERMQQEVMSVERHMLAIRKQLILTPQKEKTRRWFLNDMMNFILPKTDLLLRDFIGLLQSFGVEDVVYNMGVIRLMDEKARESENVVQLALEVVDAAMPNELLRFSGGRLRDVLHSGNINYAVRRLREHYQGAAQEQAANQQPGTTTNVNSPDDPYAMAQQHRRPGAQPSHLNEIDREISSLEKKMASANWGQAHRDGGDGLDHLGEDDDEDDVESVFDNLQQRGPTAAEKRAAANFDGGRLRDGGDSAVVSGVTGTGSGPSDVTHPDRYLASAQPPGGGTGAAPPAASKSALHPMQAATGIPASNFQAPSMDEFEAMYAAVDSAARK